MRWKATVFGIGETPKRRRRFDGYVVAVLATFLALLLRVLTASYVGQSGPFLFFAPSVMLSAWYGGFGPGLLATVLGAAAADYFLLVPVGSFSVEPSDMAEVGVFLIVGLQISWLSGALYAAMHRSKADARNARESEQRFRTLADELEVRVRERTAELEFRKTLLESQANASVDGILVVSEEGTVIFHNHRFAELWRLEDRTISGDATALATKLRSELADGQEPLSTSSATTGAGDAEAPANLVLRDGRTLECHSAPVRSIEGRSYGLVWYFRDITERKRLNREILEAGERERQRIGQDLHDDLCQQLTGITFLARVLQERLGAAAGAEAQTAGRIAELVEQAVKRARDIARGLEPLQLQGGALSTALQELATTVEAMFPVHVHVDCDRSVRLDEASAIQLYRITQEAIHNAVRHGLAHNIYMDLLEAGDRIILSIEDDGIGIPPDAPRRGLGLHTMQHRARIIGATVSVEAVDSSGTIVTCRLPVRTPQPEQQPA